MEEFWGVDDPEDRKRLREAALRRDSLAKRLFALFKIAGAVALAIFLASLWLPNLLGSDSLIRAIVIGVLAGLATSAWLKRRVHENMRCILRSEGRCERCGYRLLGQDVSKCPECGQGEHQE